VQSIDRSWPRGVLECLVVTAGLAALTVALTYPLAFRLATHGYRLHVLGDHQYSVWNVAWVAHALVTDPLNVLNANIFYPHPRTLLYSEANLATGALGVPVYWLTRNPFATHNFVVLLSFVLSGLGTYYLVRYLTRDRRAAAVSAIAFAFCPYVFGHLPHIQLLMTAGIPFSLLAFHRLADAPSPGRGAALGVAMGTQGLACAYYSIFVALLVGSAVIGTAARGRWGDARFWKAVASAAGVAFAIVGPLLLAYLALDRDGAFGRTLDESRRFAATWQEYVTANSHSARWFAPAGGTDLLFPGFVATSFGLAGAVWGWHAGGRLRYLAMFYACTAGLALWFSLGPAGGLYSVASRFVPGFSLLRAPSRFGMLVTLALALLAGLAAAELFRNRRRANLFAAALLVLAVTERVVPVPITPNPEIPPVYTFLAAQPRGAVIELPPLSRRFAFTRTRYMLASTVHWMPLVNGYSDFTPKAFDDRLDVLAEFPAPASLRFLRQDTVRYAVVHEEPYRTSGALPQLEARLVESAPYLKLLYRDDDQRLYELLGAPPDR
jgi:hypothetical protein